MQTISAKVVHLGDQLESVHSPRARAFEALQLMKHFDEFMADQPLSSPIFTDPDRLLESAEMIHKLSSVSQELVRDRFQQVQQRIARKYVEIEELLYREFERTLDKKRLREIASVLSEFRCFSRCVDAFVERAQQGAFHSDNVFDDIQHVCEKTKPLIDEIFPDPNLVMNKLILNLFHGKLQETLSMKLDDSRNESEQYLRNLKDFYLNTERLGAALKVYQSESDQQFITTLIQSLFNPYLKEYPEIEERFINEQCQSILNSYYENKGHQKRNLSAGGLGEFKRDLQARLLTVENFGGETFLSEEVAINILQELKNAFTRCNLMCKKAASIPMVQSLFDLLLKYLYNEHVDYAIELALAGISLAGPRTEPPTNFFAVVQQTAAVTHLFIKQFEDLIAPLVKDTSVQERINSERDRTLLNVETRINLGLERQINALVGYVKFILSTEQKRSDFKPEDENRPISSMSKACALVVRYVQTMYDRITESVDGKNLAAVLTEFGHGFYLAVFNHVKAFNYNPTGALLLVCDINEYMKCVTEWRIPEVRRQFESLHALSNLMVVRPDNLVEAVAAASLSEMDRNVVQSFLRLREDARECQLFLSTM
ncbi:unnamed protein product [Bursaphelenchus okinawaensis]|uniref:Exocyst complex component 5 n=1 Tax=Bursaphelenchus okinawaensis TaxID=465554 RepID=A0A811L2Z1_9BILA|nr:unnamed protein product [Bursaphelenchus okinawaensis]CAG9115142.1 unnamed protein product [Bursaphelenchus okinawaensis]